MLQGTGTADELAIDERTVLAVEGIVISSLDIIRPKADIASREDPDQSPGDHRLRARVRVTTRGMWVDQGKLLQRLHQVGVLVSSARVLQVFGKTGGKVWITSRCSGRACVGRASHPTFEGMLQVWAEIGMGVMSPKPNRNLVMHKPPPP